MKLPDSFWETTRGHYDGIALTSAREGVPCNHCESNPNNPALIQEPLDFHAHYNLPGHTKAKSGIASFTPRFPVGVNATRVGLETLNSARMLHEDLLNKSARERSFRHDMTLRDRPPPPPQTSSPVPPPINNLDVGVVVKGKSRRINVREYPWPSDRTHRRETSSGERRGDHLPNGTYSLQTHGRYLKEVPEPKVCYTPRYASHVQRIGINTQRVGSTFGDATEEYLCKRVVRGTIDEGATVLSRILPTLPAVPSTIEDNVYRKTRSEQGRNVDKSVLQRTFSKTYRSDNEKLRVYVREALATNSLTGTLRTNPAIISDTNVTPFPKTPRYH